MNEFERINSVYKERNDNEVSDLYRWSLNSVQYSISVKNRLFSSSISTMIGDDLSDLTVLDVGCGNGSFIRRLIEWGATPSNLSGTEYIEDRLASASVISPSSVEFNLGSLDKLSNNKQYDLVSAHTVFSSVLDFSERKLLAKQMWDLVRPGGVIMIFDFRYNNPRNKNVYKVTKEELCSYWSGGSIYYKTGILAPPLARYLVGKTWVIPELLTIILPFLRSHFVYLVRK